MLIMISVRISYFRLMDCNGEVNCNVTNAFVDASGSGIDCFIESFTVADAMRHG